MFTEVDISESASDLLEFSHVAYIHISFCLNETTAMIHEISDMFEYSTRASSLIIKDYCYV